MPHIMSVPVSFFKKTNCAGTLAGIAVLSGM